MSRSRRAGRSWLAAAALAAAASLATAVDFGISGAVKGAGGRLADSVTAKETVSEPGRSGPTALTAGISYAFTTGDATSTLGHALEYRFTWGDGTNSGWSAAAGGSHAWTSAGAFVVRAEARCAAHPLVAASSAGLAVAVTGTTLKAALGFLPAYVTTGDWVTVALTVTNTAGPDALAVTPSLSAGVGAGLLTLVGGPVPAGPLAVPAGGARTFSWTYSVGGTGTVILAASAGGRDGATGAAAVASTAGTLLSTGLISTVAGTGVAGYSGDGFAATTARLDDPRGVAVDAGGTVYIADWANGRVRKVDPGTGVISTVAGTGATSFNGDGIPATGANLAFPEALAVDALGNLYIAADNRIRRVDAAAGTISTVAGTGVGGYNGDGIAATAAQIAPSGIALDTAGNLFIAEANNFLVRKVSAGTGLISTVAGTGVSGYNGDGIAATAAQLPYPQSLAVDASGNLFVEAGGARIRKISSATGLISTVAGNGAFDGTFSGDGIAATAANGSWGVIAVNSAGDIFAGYFDYIAPYRVRKVEAATGLLHTAAGGSSAGYYGDGVPAASNKISSLAGVALDGAGNVYFSDRGVHKIRKVTRP